MSWLICLGNLNKILFLDSHAKNLQVGTNLDVFMERNTVRSWQDLPRFSMFLVKLYQVSFHRERIGKNCFTTHKMNSKILKILGGG